MRLDLPRLRERFGAVLFYGLQSVYALDSGLIADEGLSQKEDAIQRLPYELLHAQLSDMVIVVPIFEERLRLLDGVLAGIPHACKIIVVSNSSREPIDRFELESDLARTFNAYTHRDISIVHQRDPLYGQAFAEAGYTDLLDEQGLIRPGKAEGMILGIMLAQMTGRRTVGFIDSDNYFAGSVLEYCQLYAAGFAMSKGKDFAMVRVSWAHKPKIVENNLYFAKWGRSSVITNEFLNRLVSHYTGFETEAIRTGNAGEHALTLELAIQMAHSSGYSIEPYQLVYLMEQFGGIEPPETVLGLQSVIRNTANVYQVESRNPHLHEYKGEEHVDRMIEASLSVIYHSYLCPPALKAEIRQALADRKIRPITEEIPKMRQYPPLAGLDMGAFQRVAEDQVKPPTKKPR